MTHTEWCRMYTTLSESQMAWVAQIADLLPFAATASHQDVLLYVFAKSQGDQWLVVDAYQANGQPQTEPHVAGQCVPVTDEPTWDWDGQPMEARQQILHTERGVQQVYLYPLVDNGGRLLGALRFVDSEGREEATLLAETAAMAITAPDWNRLALYTPVSYTEGLLIFDAEGLILYGNEAARHLGDWLGLPKPLCGASVFGGRIKLSRLKQWLRQHQAEVTEEWYDTMALRQRVLPVVSGGKVTRSYLLLEDRTLQEANERALRMQNSIIKEIHHRVKNHLQMVTSLLRLQARRSGVPAVQEALQESVHRMESLALVHDMLCHYREESVEISHIWGELVRLLQKSMGAPGQTIDVEYRGDTIEVSAEQASYISLLFNEIIVNAWEHAFAGRSTGKLVLEGKRLDAVQVMLRIWDDGPGVPADFEEKARTRLGMQILRTLVEGQLAGTLSFSQTDPHGLTVTIVFARDI